MPYFPSAAFLLWQEAVVSGNWGRLLRMPAEADTMLAVWMLQEFGKELPKGMDGGADFISNFLGS